MSEEIAICDCEHNKPSPMNIEVNSPYTDCVGEGLYATVQCASYGCLRRFNRRFGYLSDEMWSDRYRGSGAENLPAH